MKTTNSSPTTTNQNPLKENTMTRNKRRTISTLAVSSTVIMGGATPALAIDGSPTPPPGFDFVSTLVGWALYIAAFVLFIYFIIGIVTAAKARRSGDQEITAPLWPLLGGAALTVVGVVWQSVVGI
ncbi:MULTISPECIES: hypothetical protein [Kocuria]|uniref:hypothetical protein n=1 Tax=Kocuria TaxID=57493 RepID=UPI0011A88050|nr:hypothetical protein [Kocuria indica]MBN6812866.1 hypothetical protein [Kocuria indica]MBN6844563.1 hypothetical protein [Kocuria indica]